MRRISEFIFMSAMLAAGSAVANGEALSTAASQSQGWTFSGLLMLAPGALIGLVILWLAASAPVWRRRHLHHW
jgi:pheromone shutdown protein TraB